MNELDVIRDQVKQLLVRGQQSGLGPEEKGQILAEVNQLWTKLAAVNAQREQERIAS